MEMFILYIIGRTGVFVNLFYLPYQADIFPGDAAHGRKARAMGAAT